MSKIIKLDSDLESVDDVKVSNPLAGENYVSVKTANEKRLNALSLKYGANQIYAVEKLPAPGFLYEYKDQIVVLTYVEEGKMENLMLFSVQPKDKFLNVKGYDKNSNLREFTVDMVGAGKEDSTGKAVRIFPASYAQFISETTIFHKDTLKRAWEKCKNISKADFKSYSSDSGNALLNTVDNVGLVVKLNEDDYLYIRINRVVWESKEKTFSIFHGSEEMKFHSFPGHEFKFDNEDNAFTNIQFKIEGIMGNYSPIYKFNDIRCKIIDLKDMCK